ncbi:MAG TPA: FG-GAP-like repeat-containing protein [Pirellulales bacterium]|nr:FG-GAP-like repeat-containing protein [Pirellulales bacterium]
MWFRSMVGSFKSSTGSNPSRTKRRRQNRPRAAQRLQFESLESRSLLTFIAPVDYAAAGPSVAEVAADLANNGIQDLVVATQPNTVSVLPGNGDGTFGPPTAFATGASPVSVAVGDLTGNGKLDIVTANYSYSPEAGSVSVLLGNGDGTFQPATTFNLPGVFPRGYTGTTPLPQHVMSVAIGDMNHDARPDVVVTAQTSFFNSNGTEVYDGLVDVLLGNGSGAFSGASTTSVPNAAKLGSVELADFGNGKLDVAASFVSLSEPSGVAVLLGKGDGTLGAPATYAATYSAGSVAVGDVNGDGKLDLLTAGGYDNAAGVSVLLGNGDGTFQAATYTNLPILPQGGNITRDSLVMGDLNGDGKLDLAVAAQYDYGRGSPYGRTYYWGSNVNVLLGNGDGTFTAAQTIPLYNISPDSITAADFNGDGYPDLAVTNQDSATISVLMNEADSSATPATATSFAVSGFAATTMAGTPSSFSVTALNPDGTIDTGYTGTVRFSSSDGQAALPANYTFTAADAGKHTFSATLKTAGTQSIMATDTSTGTLTGSETGITVTSAAASHFAVSAPASATAGSSFSVTVTALDPYNNTASGYAGTVHFTSSDGQASLPANYAFTASDAGVHTFTNAVALKTAGNQTVIATDTTTSSITGGSTVAVNAAAASTMVVSGFASPITAGTSGSFTVTLKDAYGNVATGYTGTVHFTSSDTKAVLPTNYTFTSADAGKHVFSATLKTAGAQSITATDTVNASLHGTDSGITVKPAAASKLVLSAPASVQPGAPFSLTVTVEDAYGNIVTGYSGTIHFSSSDNKAILPANYTFTAGNNGVHTFTGLVLKKAGNQTITVTDTKNSSISGKTVVDAL